jgi:hypothetical protein
MFLHIEARGLFFAVLYTIFLSSQSYSRMMKRDFLIVYSMHILESVMHHMIFCILLIKHRVENVKGTTHFPADPSTVVTRQK